MIDSLAMEWQKLRPLHKTSRMVALAITMAVVVSAIVAAAMASNGAQMSLSDRRGFDSVGTSLQGINAAVLVVAAFGALSVTREYATGMIRTTFLTQPARLRVLTAKLGIHAAVAGVAAACACLAAFAVGQALLNSAGLSVGWGNSHLAAALGGGVIYLVLVCLWGAALGALLRSSSSAITWLASLLVVAPVIVQILPQHVIDLFGRWLPSQIGQQAISSSPNAHSFSAWIGLTVLAGYVAVTLVAGAWRMARTDP
ncbi:MAG: type transport system permease protein [Pseudonocardiales bacterium]|nr:type transport system permease protein [Pseudonocardiales bacterium]MDT4963234.1 type transport system permease protein [Pseudonocardiales bacterium]MDT4970091.1 type transport system permease protein [Pseudonocardiales bacterium]MDT4980342.1 type transport system permease protein [Pseudonocardiales bacterium]